MIDAMALRDMASRTASWRDIEVIDRRSLRRALLMKHGTLTKAAEVMGIPYIRLSAMLCGREQTINHVAAIQSDLGLSDRQVLHLWPLLKSWPKESRVVN